MFHKEPVSLASRVDGIVGEIDASELLQELNLQLSFTFMLRMTRLSWEEFFR